VDRYMRFPNRRLARFRRLVVWALIAVNNLARNSSTAPLRENETRYMGSRPAQAGARLALAPLRHG
jgi:hypothetical protein